MDSQENLTAVIVPFYLGECPDVEGRKIQEIWAWDFEELECVHNYVQWLFPLTEQSHFNPQAPVADQEVIRSFREDPRLRQHLSQSFSVMLNFYGLAIASDKRVALTVEKSETYLQRKKEWVNMLDHNYLRITRILKCLMAFGLEEEAQAFYKCLSQIYREESDQIGGETFQYWTDAVSSPDC